MRLDVPISIIIKIKRYVAASRSIAFCNKLHLTIKYGAVKSFAVVRGGASWGVEGEEESSLTRLNCCVEARVYKDMGSSYGYSLAHHPPPCATLNPFGDCITVK